MCIYCDDHINGLFTHAWNLVGEIICNTPTEQGVNDEIVSSELRATVDNEDEDENYDESIGTLKRPGEDKPKAKVGKVHRSRAAAATTGGDGCCIFICCMSAVNLRTTCM